MSRKKVIQFIDDVTGEVLTDDNRVTMEFIDLKGQVRSIDLSKKNAEEFGRVRKNCSQDEDSRNAMKKFISASRPVKVVSVGYYSRDTSYQVRSWAKRTGLKISDRGKIPVEIIEKYNDHMSNISNAVV